MSRSDRIRLLGKFWNALGITAIAAGVVLPLLALRVTHNLSILVLTLVVCLFGVAAVANGRALLRGSLIAQPLTILLSSLLILAGIIGIALSIVQYSKSSSTRSTTQEIALPAGAIAIYSLLTIRSKETKETLARPKT